MLSRRFVMTVAILSLVGASLPIAATAKSAAPPRKPDLADAVEGGYFGDVISDSAGSSKSDVAITVTRVGRNQVQITSPYPRLPMITVRLERAMGKIVNANGDSPFVFDPAKSPAHLDVSFHNEVSWSGERR
jgi:hypothetical protein